MRTHARTAPDHEALLAPDVPPVTYGELWRRTDDTIRQLRRLGVSRGDRVAVILPRGAETAMAIIAVTTAAVCVPLNPDLTADELQRYFSDLKIAALLTRADMNSASRSVAHSLGIAVIDLSPRRADGLGAFDLVGSTPVRAGTGDLASADERRIHSVDLGNDVAAEDGPVNPCECLPFGLQRRCGFGASP